MIILKNKLSGLLLPGLFPAMTVWPFIFVRPDTELNIQHLLNHEIIHARQQIEMLWIFFFIWYCVEFIYRLIKKGKWLEAYRNIGFEKEAYRHDTDLNYLKSRKIFAWLKYL